MLKRKIATFVAAISFLTTSAFAVQTINAATASTDIKVQYNGKGLTFPDQKPIIRDSRTLVPIRPIAEGLGFKVGWDDKTRTVSIEKNGTNVNLVVNQKVAKKNNESITLDVPAQIVNSRTMVPVRFIAEALSYEVNWSNADRTVLITDKQVAQGDLIDKKSITEKGVNFFNARIYIISGKVADGSKVNIEIEGKTVSVPVKNGVFEYEHTSAKDVPGYKLVVTKDGKTDTYEGKLTIKTAYTPGNLG